MEDILHASKFDRIDPECLCRRNPVNLTGMDTLAPATFFFKCPEGKKYCLCSFDLPREHQHHPSALRTNEQLHTVHFNQQMKPATHPPTITIKTTTITTSMPRLLAPKPQLPPQPQTTVPETCIPSKQLPSPPSHHQKLTQPRDCLNQYSLSTAYNLGLTSSGPPVVLLPIYGDHAYALTPDGTPILILDSKIYCFDSQSTTNAPPPSTPIAFAIITLFRPSDRTNNASGGDTLSNLRLTFSQSGGSGKNHPIVFAIRGAFSSVSFTTGARLENVQGTVFGFALPKWLEGLSFSSSGSGSGSRVRCLFLSGCRGRGGGELPEHSGDVCRVGDRRAFSRRVAEGWEVWGDGVVF